MSRPPAVSDCGLIPYARPSSDGRIPRSRPARSWSPVVKYRTECVGAFLLLARAATRVAHGVHAKFAPAPCSAVTFAMPYALQQSKERHLVEGPEIKFAEAVLD